HDRGGGADPWPPPSVSVWRLRMSLTTRLSSSLTSSCAALANPCTAPSLEWRGGADALPRQVHVACRSRYMSPWRGSRSTSNDILLSSTLRGRKRRTMNSDHFTPDTPPAPEVAPEETGVSTPRRRRRARRATAQAPLEQAAGPELAVSAAPEEETTPAPPTRPRRRRAARAAPVAAPAAELPAAAPEAEVLEAAPAVEVLEAAPAVEVLEAAPAVEAPEAASEGSAIVPDAPTEEAGVMLAEEALAATGGAAGEVAEEGRPAHTTRRRRRNRGGHGVAAEGAGEAGAPAAAAAAPVT